MKNNLIVLEFYFKKYSAVATIFSISISPIKRFYTIHFSEAFTQQVLNRLFYIYGSDAILQYTVANLKLLSLPLS